MLHKRSFICIFVCVLLVSVSVKAGTGFIATGDAVLKTIAGNGVAGSTGEDVVPTDAMLKNPRGIAIDDDDEFLYIADGLNNCIRKMSLDQDYTQRRITTIAGVCGTAPGKVNDPTNPANSVDASLNTPSGVDIDANGNVIFADSINFRIRMVIKCLIIKIQTMITIKLWYLSDQVHCC